ncbi:hypothetical protein VTI74DRAFT_8701 [Chaetomium olivicolor]
MVATPIQEMGAQWLTFNRDEEAEGIALDTVLQYEHDYGLTPWASFDAEGPGTPRHPLEVQPAHVFSVTGIGRGEMVFPQDATFFAPDGSAMDFSGYPPSDIGPPEVSTGLSTGTATSPLSYQQTGSPSSGASSPNRIYRCTVPNCKDKDKEFGRPSDLRRHDKIHTRPYKCLFCKVFRGAAGQRDLDRHHWYHHNNEVRNDKRCSRVEVPCPKCGSRMRSDNLTRRHIKTCKGARLS